MEKVEFIDGLLKQYFYHKDRYTKLVSEIDDTWHTFTGMHSPNLNGIPSTPEDKGHKILRIGEDKIKPLEIERDKEKFEMDILYQKLRLMTLDEIEYQILELIYRYKYRLDDIAIKVGYADKSVVCRKQKKIIEEISKYV